MTIDGLDHAIAVLALLTAATALGLSINNFLTQLRKQDLLPLRESINVLADEMGARDEIYKLINRIRKIEEKEFSTKQVFKG